MIQGRNACEKQLFGLLEQNGQSHLLRFWDELNDAGKDRLIRDLKKIDFKLFKRILDIEDEVVPKNRDVSLPPLIEIPKSQARKKREEEAFEAGCRLIGESKLAVFTAAGGQSSRLGLDYPKGAYLVTPIKNKPLFQVYAEKIRYMQDRFGVGIPWIIMVSETNKGQTRDFFESNGFFGLKIDRVRFVKQGGFPAYDPSGKIFLREKGRVFISPSGHGGAFLTLKESGALSWLQNLGIEELFYSQVDNVLVKLLDPVFIGYHTLAKSEMSSKCVMKRHPEEKVGVFVLEKERMTVVEYTELELLDGLGPESFRAGSIAIHMINLEFARRLVRGGLKLPLHRAYKRIPHVDRNGESVDPESPNGYKIETLIFDALKYANNSVVMEVAREEEFSPLKNRSGDDSPSTVKKDQVMFFSRWLEEAGVKILKDSRGIPKYRIEVSPLFASLKDDFLEKAPKRLTVEKDTYIE